MINFHTMKRLLPSTIILSLLLLLGSCTVQQLSYTQKTYQNTQKSDETVQVQYTLPVVKPAAKTTQEQTKGGVTISVEVLSFSAHLMEEEEENVAYKIPAQADYDVFEIRKTPYYRVSPENIRFKIRIRNREDVPLKLSEVGFALIIDGTQWSFPSTHLEEWNKGLILSGFEKEYFVDGPQLDGLVNAQVVYLFLNGVPVSYDKAGNVTEKKNFEWFFECSSTEVTKEEEVHYEYVSRPIHKERCHKCTGTGKDPQLYKCDKCAGNGAYISKIDGKTYKCSKCDGTGKIQVTCDHCKGTGVLEYPKSTLPPVDQSITWNGWKVTVSTIPKGASIKIVDPETGVYTAAPYNTPVITPWYYTGTDKRPIIIEYNGQTAKILPYHEGAPSARVVVDFSSGTPVVTRGELVAE